MACLADAPVGARLLKCYSKKSVPARDAVRQQGNSVEGLSPVHALYGNLYGHLVNDAERGGVLAVQMHARVRFHAGESVAVAAEAARAEGEERQAHGRQQSAVRPR